MNHEAAAQEAGRTTSVLTCNINGIPLQERVRYGQLVEVLRHAIQKRRELPDGYAFQMDTKQIGTDQLAEWIELERKCCPFFEFEIHWTPQNGDVWLHLSGPEGVKDFILDEFGVEVRTQLDGSGLLDRQHDRTIVSTPFHSLFRRFEKLSIGQKI